MKAITLFDKFMKLLGGNDFTHKGALQEIHNRYGHGRNGTRDRRSVSDAIIFYMNYNRKVYFYGYKGRNGTYTCLYEREKYRYDKYNKRHNYLQSSIHHGWYKRDIYKFEKLLCRKFGLNRTFVSI